MYLLWRITDELSELTVEEFNQEHNGIFGYLKLQLEEYSIGYILDESISLEGNSDILYYIGKLIECGISMCQRTPMDIDLLNYNLLKLHIYYCDGVIINVIDNEDGSVKFSYKLLFSELAREIEYNYIKFYRFIQQHNALLAEAGLIKKTLLLYDVWRELVDT